MAQYAAILFGGSGVIPISGKNPSIMNRDRESRQSSWRLQEATTGKSDSSSSKRAIDRLERGQLL
jgi:hypothetical protein